LVRAVALRKRFPVARGLTALNLDWSGRLPRLRYRLTYITAVDRISLSIDTGETLGLVGESGCGKSTLGRLLLRLIKASSGTVEFAGVDVQHLDGRALRRFRQGTQIVFQNADSSLNPRLSVAEAIGRPLYLFNGGTSAERERRVLELLDMVQLPRSYSRRYPFQLSGGERQRVAIARALATRPRFIVCDEPVSALDVSVQATIINLLADLRDAFGLSYLFISHDLAVVAQLAGRIAVMYRGSICELGSARDVLCSPRHPYTVAKSKSRCEKPFR
jgi:peptide/nickel transport system ATP-binding protein